MRILRSVILITIALLTFSFVKVNNSNKDKERAMNIGQEKDLKVAYFASGCFWCVEAIFESVRGVEEAISGYAGGHTNNPTYQKIGTGRTGHSETVAVYYNPKIVSFQTLVDVYYGSHNPTTKNGQHPDYGSQYRSIAFYNNNNEKEIIDRTIKKLNKEIYKGKIATEVTKLTKFYPAEDYHQNYERLHPNNPYVRNVSIPRLNRFKKKFPELLKKEKH
ncbi:peptide-methionine (S)-S-oxide reductase MsrA [Tenacibaculum sp. S7007]|uniref:Peptide methionine sulfoxide reductase MsrA n=1 Tax=Tenacibaculum pelagium TaxID=2759527 RepID=A0A839ALF7_9FLAO|nr:peptide-methionine (S)-S-oxide reductase MsrA [Tenacibaculum pelagium]MBA6155228.1 peptide-methionine (S)-S-oxide reductase MsrA [Tenacibaculum pelagium]